MASVYSQEFETSTMNSAYTRKMSASLSYELLHFLFSPCELCDFSSRRYGHCRHVVLSRDHVWEKKTLCPVNDLCCCIFFVASQKTILSIIGTFIIESWWFFISREQYSDMRAYMTVCKLSLFLSTITPFPSAYIPLFHLLLWCNIHMSILWALQNHTLSYTKSKFDLLSLCTCKAYY